MSPPPVFPQLRSAARWPRCLRRLNEAHWTLCGGVPEVKRPAASQGGCASAKKVRQRRAVRRQEKKRVRERNVATSSCSLESINKEPQREHQFTAEVIRPELSLRRITLPEWPRW